jgi:hypothetical protein
MRGPAGRVRADYVRQFVPNDGERSLLIDPVPVRERTALDVQVQHMIRLVDRIRTKEAEQSLNNRLFSSGVPS